MTPYQIDRELAATLSYRMILERALKGKKNDKQTQPIFEQHKRCEEAERRLLKERCAATEGGAQS